MDILFPMGRTGSLPVKIKKRLFLPKPGLQDVLLYPLFDGTGDPIGLVSLKSPRQGQRPDQSMLDTIEIFTGQIGLMIQNIRRLSTYKSRWIPFPPVWIVNNRC